MEFQAQLAGLIPGPASYDLTALAADLQSAVANGHTKTANEIAAELGPTLADCLPWYRKTATELGFRGTRRHGSLKTGLRIPRADNWEPHRPAPHGTPYDLGKQLTFPAWAETVKEFVNRIEGTLTSPVENYHIEAALCDFLTAFPQVTAHGTGTHDHLTQHLPERTMKGILGAHYYALAPRRCRTWSPALDAAHGPFYSPYHPEPLY